MATTTPASNSSRSTKFTYTFERIVIEAKHRTPNGNEVEFQLVKLCNYYQILKIPDNVDRRFLCTKFNNDIPSLQHITNQDAILKYFEMFSILIYYREFYDKYLCIAQFLEGIIIDPNNPYSKVTTSSLKQCLDTISTLIYDAEKRTNKFVLNIQLSSPPSSTPSPSGGWAATW